MGASSAHERDGTTNVACCEIGSRPLRSDEAMTCATRRWEGGGYLCRAATATPAREWVCSTHAAQQEEGRGETK